MLWWTLRQLKSRNKWKARQAAGKLGELRDARAVEPLVAALKDKELRPAAMSALIQIGAASVQPLITRLKLASVDEAKAAVDALGQIGDPQAVKPVIEAFNRQGDKLQAETVAALTKFGAAAVEPLLTVLNKRVRVQMSMAIAALGRIRDRRAVAPLIGLLGNDSSWTAREAAEALGNLQDPRAVEPLSEFLMRSDSVFDLEPAMKALERIGDSRAAKPLAGLLRHRNGDVRIKAVFALRSLGWQPEDDTQRVALAIAGSRWDEAVAIGAAAVPSLLEELNRDIASYDRDRIKETLAKIGAPAIEYLEAALTGQSFVTRRAAWEALKQIGWQPKDDRMRACLAVVIEDWYKVSKFGGVAVRPLLAVLRSSTEGGGEFAADKVERARSALRDLLKRSAEEVDTEELREIAGLPNGASFSYQVPSCGAYTAMQSKGVDYAQIKQLARQELIRRGAEA